MTAWLPVLVAMPFAGLLLLSGPWAGGRYARFERLPGHYDIAGKPTRMASRTMMVWTLPVVCTFVLLAIAIYSAAVPPEMLNGDPVTGVVVGGIGLFAAQLLMLWLTARWASRQP